jgi:phosphohistidine phosphatase
VLVIGHNPGLERLAAALAEEGPVRARLLAKFPTGALATLSIGAATWRAVQPGGAELTAFIVPRELD